MSDSTAPMTTSTTATTGAGSSVSAAGSALREWLQHAPPAKEPGAGKEWNVFLSYRSVNRAWVINLYDVLRGHGHKVFLDQCVIVGGDSLIRALETALARSEAGVLVWSTATEDSEWVRREYETMERMVDGKGFRFVPVRLDAAELPVFAQRHVFLDFSQYPDGPNGGELLRLLHAIVGRALTPEALRFAEQQDEAAQDFTARVKAAIANGRPNRLRELFSGGGAVWQISSALGCAVAEGLTKLKDYEGALAVLATLEGWFPRAIRPKQLKALALARRAGPGDLDTAQEILGVLYEQGDRDPETLGIYGRTWMDRYRLSNDVSDLRQSRDYYAAAFETAQDDYYTGINAASKSVLLGTPTEIARGRQLADRVQAIVDDRSIQDNYWKRATAAEVQLLKGNFTTAAALYQSAVDRAPKELGSHESTWKQAADLMAVLKPPASERELVRAPFQHIAAPA